MCKLGSNIINLMDKYLSATKSIFAIVGLFSVITLSIATVLALNPKAYEASNNDPISSVLGESASRDSKLPFIITNLNSNQEIKTSLKKIAESGSYSYDVVLNSVKAPFFQTGFIKIENPNNYDAKLLIKTSLKGEVQDNLQISMVENLNELILYTPNQKAIVREVNIPKQSSRSFDIKYQVDQNINFPLNINFTLTPQ